MDKDDDSDKKQLVARLHRLDLFIPGFCTNPEADVPDLNIRIFKRKGKPTAFGFTSLRNMQVYFSKTQLESLKYMRIIAPDHIEMICGIGHDLVLDPATRGEQFVRLAELREILGLATS
jgi:hypothetical protein